MRTCKYCGNNPVPHFIYWYNESANIFFTPIRNFLLYNKIVEYVVKKKWGVKLVLEFLFFAESLKIISRQKDINKCKVRRAQVLWQEAEKRGINMQELLLFKKPFDCYVVEGRGYRVEGIDKTTNYKLQTINSFVFSGLPRPAGYYNPRLDLMDDKAWFKKFMKKNGLPVPVGGAVTSFKQARKILRQILEIKKLDIRNFDTAENKLISQFPNFPISNFTIVKPRSGSRGRHSTTFIESELELKQAFKIAKQLCYWVVVEEQLFGPVYRATVINFKLAGVLRGDSPQVVGDGRKAIKELVLEKNSKEHPGVKDIILDDRAESFVERQLSKEEGTGKSEDRTKSSLNTYPSSLDFIPKQGQVIYLSEKIGVSYGGSASEDLEICHQDNKELFETAARILGDPILGFDFIIPDITKSYKTQKCGFIEVNTLPFINLHHDVALGKPQNVAGKIWDMVLN